ncbi:MAG: sulfatase-like hydrolase/transferase [Planctomycetota bacterium]|nr:sulfatase-like hydrolase/transferase [Planctomycetota bacterium]
MRIVVLIFSTVATLAATIALAEPPAPRPNVILVMADDMGWGDAAYNGHPVLKTPHLDEMSKAGLRFDRFYAPTVCSPTRASCLTGRHPFRQGIYSANIGHLPAEEQTLAEVARSAGYTTGHFGKWHLGTLTNDVQDGRRGGRDKRAFAPPWLHGFDHTFSTEQSVPTWNPMEKQPFATKFWTGPGKFATENLEGDVSRVTMDRAIPFIRQATESKQPFLAVIWFHAPHKPVRAGAAYKKLYADRSKIEQEYYGCLTAMDEQVGRLRKELRDLQVADNTILWFCSDNGPEGGSDAPGSAGPLKGRKRDLWEGGIRVPGLLEWPGVIRNPRVVQTPCVTSDILPTVLDYLDVKSTGPAPTDGISLRPLIEGQVTERGAGIGFEYGNMAVWLADRYKLVALLDGGGDEPDEDGVRADSAKGKSKQAKSKKRKSSQRLEPAEKQTRQLLLFDIVADPKEQHDLAAANPKIVQAMRAELIAWQASCRRSATGKDYTAVGKTSSPKVAK